MTREGVLVYRKSDAIGRGGVIEKIAVNLSDGLFGDKVENNLISSDVEIAT